MAPEQAAADPATDARADIYAFGVMAYEMLAGHPPFAGRSTQGVVAAHATEMPQPIGVIRRATPAPLADLVMRCLEKRPGDRPQSATEILRALDATATATSAGTLSASQPAARPAARGIAIIERSLPAASPRRWRSRQTCGGARPDEHASDGAARSIAVVPFENKSGDSTFDYLEDGITDHVRDALNGLPQLAVKARGSSRQLKGHPSRDIGSKLGVGVIVQGAVSGSASHLHVTAELVRVADDAALWSGTFDRPANELAGIQDSIVQAVIGKLRLAGDGARGGKSRVRAARGTTNVEAYDRFLKAYHAYDSNDFSTAIALFKEAIALDPNYARAHALIAQAYAGVPTLGLARADSFNALARASARTALALDPTLADARAVEALVLGNELQVGASLEALEKALAMDTTNVALVSVYGQTLGQVGRVGDALVQGRRARDLDPYSGTAVGLLSYAYYLAGDYDAAITTVRAALDIDPANPIMFRALGYYYAFKGVPDSAVKAFETAFKLGPTIFGGRSNLVFGYAVAGRWDKAAQQRALLERENAGNSPNYYRMMTSLSFGNYDAAMSALERGVAAHESLFILVSIACDRIFDPLKSDPRFDALMRRLGVHAAARMHNGPSHRDQQHTSPSVPGGHEPDRCTANIRSVADRLQCCWAAQRPRRNRTQRRVC